MASLKEQFLLEMKSDRSQRLSKILANGYMQLEKCQLDRIEMIRRSRRTRRDCYPYVPVERQIRKRIGIFRGMIAKSCRRRVKDCS